MITAQRYHDISCGHRVHGHESKCAYLHGHNYRFIFTVAPIAGLDDVGRVLDFSAINARLCMWLEANYDHKFLAWERDPIMRGIASLADESTQYENDLSKMLGASIVWTPFNPTAENLARHMLYVIGPQQLADTSVVLVAVKVEETRKCSAFVTLDDRNEVVK